MKEHGFSIRNKQRIEELGCTLHELVHEQSQAKVIHLENDDPENLFCLSFRTTPTTSNGVAHILEHIALCGSQRFPVRDPFFAMTRRSLHTFMNALTGADFTCYPAATLIKKDFYNLLDVYLDAVFYPRLTRESFYQEGWRYDLKHNTLSYHGIVFNEMKGALSSPTTRLVEALNKELFPTLTYGINSGGDPAHIPSLSYEELLAFHASFYHPSRCLFFFYGNLSLEEHLHALNEKILAHTEALPPLPPIPREKRYTAPRHATHYYPLQEEDHEDQSMVALGWLTCHILEQEELLALQVLESVLMDTDASPLKKGLLESGLCKQVQSYLDGEISEVPFVLIAKGCQEGISSAFEEKVLEILNEVVKTKIPAHLIDNALHQLEFHRHEISSGSTPFGLLLFLRAGLLAQHGGTCAHGLKSHELFDQLRKHLQEHPNYLEELILKHLIHNPHRVCIQMNPSKTLQKEEDEAEHKTLQQQQAKLSQEEKEAIVSLNKKLSALQNKKEDLNCLPQLELKDIPSKSFDYPLIQKKPLYHHQCFTNGIIYSNLSFKLPSIAKEKLPFLRLFASLLTQIGSGGLHFEAHLERLHAHTGGVGASLCIDHQVNDATHYTPRLEICGKALMRKEKEFLSILTDIATTPDFTDKERLKTLLDKQFISLQSNLNSSALKYAMQLSASAHSTANALSNLWYGLPYFHFLEKLRSQPEQLVGELQQLVPLLLFSTPPDIVMTAQNPVDAQWIQAFSQRPKHNAADWNLQKMHGEARNRGISIASPVAFTALTLSSVSYTHPDNALLNIAAHIMNNTVLHKKIREQGGAYGGGCAQNSFLGIFSFHAYRDPHLYNSYQAMQTAMEEMVKGHFDQEAIKEAIFEVIQSLDTPVSPGARSEVAYTWLQEGLTPKLRQEFRERILNAQKEEIQRVVKTHLLERFHEGVLVACANEEFLEKENKKMQKTAHGLVEIIKV